MEANNEKLYHQATLQNPIGWGVCLQNRIPFITSGHFTWHQWMDHCRTIHDPSGTLFALFSPSNNPNPPLFFQLDPTGERKW